MTSVADGDPVLDNVIWHSLTGAHRDLSNGDGPARRFHPDVSVFAAVEQDDPDAWDALAKLVDHDETVVLSIDLPNGVPDGWALVGGGIGHQMVRESRPPVPTIDAEIRALTATDVPRMLELVAVAQPGPFLVRTIELGSYVGIVEDDRLVAMAGERFRTAEHTEISAVCTHPSVQRRGYAAALTSHVAAGIAARGQTPILHVTDTNVGAKRVYERLGFVERRTVSFHAIARRASA
jgi:predicted GNAT family acetyltransferase